MSKKNPPKSQGSTQAVRGTSSVSSQRSSLISSKATQTKAKSSSKPTTVLGVPSESDVGGAIEVFMRRLLQPELGEPTVQAVAEQLALSPHQQQAFQVWLNKNIQNQVFVATRQGLQLNWQAGYCVGYCARKDRYASLLTDVDAFKNNELEGLARDLLMNGDWVIARKSERTSNRKGQVRLGLVEILKRAHTQVIGRLKLEYGAWYLIPEDNRLMGRLLLTPALLPPANASKAENEHLIGQLALARIERYPDALQGATGQLVKLFGSGYEPGIETQVAVSKFDLPYEFSKAVMTEAERLPDEVIAKDWTGRVDLTDIAFVTIDGEDARDFDDAVYCEPMMHQRQKAYRLLVAIADVSHYVKPGSAIDDEAVARGTSVYFPREVIPMLPEKLSNGLCSLNPHVLRCALVCDMVIDLQGNILAYQFYKAMICSQARLTYTQVWQFLSEKVVALVLEDKTVQENINHLYDLYKILLKARQARGAIDFDTAEPKVILDSAGRIEGFSALMRNDAHRLIEECMLAANGCAAQVMESHQQTALYRVHEEANAQKMQALKDQLRARGIAFNISGEVHPKDLAKLLEDNKDHVDYEQLQLMVLRSMAQAVYAPDAVGHFGLAYDLYTHFTSPIRRYPDLMVHRVISGLLHDQHYTPHFPNRISPLTLRVRAQQPKVQGTSSTPFSKKQTSQNTPAKDYAIWRLFGEHCSAAERRADEASRDVMAWLKCFYMQDKLGEVYEGQVTAVTAFGMFVQILGSSIEGLVHISDLGNDYFVYDEKRMELRSERGHQQYRLLDRLMVQVARVDLDHRRIDFALVENTVGLLAKMSQKVRQNDLPTVDQEIQSLLTSHDAKIVSNNPLPNTTKRPSSTSTTQKEVKTPLGIQSKAKSSVATRQKKSDSKTAKKGGASHVVSNVADSKQKRSDNKTIKTTRTNTPSHLTNLSSQTTSTAKIATKRATNTKKNVK